MYKVTVCGHFGGDKDFFDGQTIKTKNLYNALLHELGDNSVNKLDTYNWKKKPLSFLLNSIKQFKNSENIVILPANNGVKVFIPLFVILKKIYKRNVFYAVVGGWLPDLLKKKHALLKKAKKLDKIFVETNLMKENLELIGVTNTEVLINFKNIKPLKEMELNKNYEKPFKVCTFSRVMEEKGIEDAINAVKEINKKHNDVVYSLDIYGSIDAKYKDRFEEIAKEFPEYINYKGCVDPGKSVETLKDYYLLLFPTRFYTEGIPGTIIDAYMSGIPVVSSKWQNFNEIVKDRYIGYGYEFGNYEQFAEILEELSDGKQIYEIKKNCLKEAEKYIPEVAIKTLTKYFI